MRRRAGGFAEFLQRAFADLCDEFGDFLHVGGLATLSAIGNRSEVGRIGFEHELAGGTAAAVSRMLWAFLKVMIPVKLTSEPSASTRRMVAGSSTKQWKTPRTRPTNGCIWASVSSSALRWWITQLSPSSAATSNCWPKMSACFCL